MMKTVAYVRGLTLQVWLTFCLTALICGLVSAQDTGQAQSQAANNTLSAASLNETAKPQQATVPIETAASVKTPAPAALAPATEEGPVVSPDVTLDFKDADIRNVLKILSYKAGVNIVVTPEVVGNVNIRLVDVPWQKALDTIVKTYGFGYEWLSDKVIMVSSLSKLAEQRKSQEEAAEKEPLDTETFVLNFSKAEDIKNVLEKIISARAKITVEKRTNTIIITDTKSNLIKIAEAIKRLDTITPQVTIEARIIETTLGKTEKLGIDWNLRVAISGSKRPITFPWTSTIKGAGSKIFPNVQVPDVLEVINTTQVSGNVTTVSREEKIWNRLSPGFPQVSADAFTFGTLDFSGLQAVLEVLKSSADTKIISNPRITTLNNQEAKILVGQVVPIPTYEYSKETGTMTISGYQNQEIGVKLIVTPNINEQEYVTLNVKPSVEDIIGSTGPNGERPIISTRSAETNVMIKDGQTLVIGGLISENKLKSKKGIPFLGDLPVLGLIFGRKQDQVTKTELLIFITPHIIKDKKPLLKEIANKLPGQP